MPRGRRSGTGKLLVIAGASEHNLKDLVVRFPLGMLICITGGSGSGKSTLIRAIAGIWPFGQGEIRAALDARILFLPQRPYLPGV